MRIFLSAILFCLLLPVAAKVYAADTAKATKGINTSEIVMDHISDKHYWHFFSIDKTDGSQWKAQVNLPVILYSSTNGLKVFSFGRFEDGKASYGGYHLDEDGHIISDDGSKFYDLSITKVVVQILISVILMFVIFLGVAKRYKNPGIAAPKGLQSALEVVILFIRDQVARPMLGKKADKYLPFLLTVFFFIWINNLIGLLPAAANVTGNINLTATMALITLVVLLFSSKRHYWMHMVTPPGAPWWLLPIMIPVEILSFITKPVALMIRLFANMVAGHLLVLSFVIIIFIFAQKSIATGLGVSVMSVAFSVFIYFLEILVTALQAYIFTILSALFIGDAAQEPEHHIDVHKEI